MGPSRLLRVNGAFLLFMGSAAATADITGHFLGKGPFGGLMFQNPLTIGSFEAHLLAVVIGALLWKSARLEDRKPFHLLAAVVHVTLGGSNLLFFDDAFGALDLRLFGAIVTAMHAAFVITEGFAAARLRSPSPGASRLSTP